MVKFSTQFQYTINTGAILELYLKFGSLGCTDSRRERGECRDAYRYPCEQYASDILSDTASKYKAAMFFKEITKVAREMEIALQTVINEKCFLSVQTLQVSNAELPTKYKDALEATNLALQDSIEVISTRTNKVIDMNTAISQA